MVNPVRVPLWMAIAGLACCLALEAQASSVASIPGLFNTGIGAADTQDSHYALSKTAGAPAIYTYGYVTQNSGGYLPNVWLANSSVSKWLTPTQDQDQSFDPSRDGVYHWVLSFDLAGYRPDTASLTGRWAADNTGVVLLNGHQLGSSSGFSSWATFSATGSLFVAGINTLDFVVTNKAQSSNNPTGLRVEFTSSSALPVPLPPASLLFASLLTGVGSVAGIRGRRRRLRVPHPTTV